MTDPHPPSVESLPVSLERDLFLRSLLRHLSGALQDVVGTEEAAGFISVVGREMGEEIGRDYRSALAVERLDRHQVAEVLVDLKRRIQGDFYVVEESEDKIVLGNRACPFGDKVRDRPALCMMTSNVFGSIAARDTGWSRSPAIGTPSSSSPCAPGPRPPSASGCSTSASTSSTRRSSGAGRRSTAGSRRWSASASPGPPPRRRAA